VRALNQSTHDLHRLDGSQASQRTASARLAGTDSGPESWEPLTGLPFPSWKEALRQVEKKITRAHPQSIGKYALWFAPMPLESIQQHQSKVRMRFMCTSQKRKQEVDPLLPMLEGVLAAELFPNRQVVIELVEQFEDAHTAGSTSQQPVAAPGDPLRPAQEQLQSSPPPSYNIHAAGPLPVEPTPATAHLDFYRQKLGGGISDEDLQAVLAALGSKEPEALAALERERHGQAGAEPAATRPAPSSPPPAANTRLDEILLEPAYATTYDEIVHDHAAIYLPAYFVRHLRHMGAADGLRYMALRQIAYRQGFRDASGAHQLPATIKELSRWSTLQPRRIYGGLDDPASYLFLLAGKVPYLDYYASRPEASRWEDASGFHWRSGGREYCLWKNSGEPTNECSQLLPDRYSGEMQWRQAPVIYRVQLSMPLCPEDEQALRSALHTFGVHADPLAAIRRCLGLPRAELIPDRPGKLALMPRKLYTVQELVMECWGNMVDRELAASVAVQARLLETHLIHAERELLKIPFYLLEKWGPYLSPAQLWTAILAMDRVYAGAGDGEYRDTTVIHNGIKEMTLWTEDQYSKGAARKITKWLYPFALHGEAPDEQGAGSPGQHFNPWFSIFVSEVLPENGARIKNADNSVQLKLRVLPLVPLCPQDTLQFARKMGLERLAIRDASGRMLALEITEEELAVYIPDGRTLRFSHCGEVHYGAGTTVSLAAHDRQLGGIEVLTSEAYYDSHGWPGDLFGSLENKPGALSGRLENHPGAHFDQLGKNAGALSGELALDPGALFGMLLKLLILNLYGIKKNAFTEKPPSVRQLENVDALEQFGSRQGQYMQWTEVEAESEWAFDSLVKSLGITDVRSLREKGVSVTALLSTVLELYATPADKFTTSRIAVLVSKLRSHPQPAPGKYMRIGELPPRQVQDCLRRAILNVSPLINDPDWDQAMGRTRRDDLIELAEKLGLGQVFSAT
jgi:hypothetical protein